MRLLLLVLCLLVWLPHQNAFLDRMHSLRRAHALSMGRNIHKAPETITPVSYTGIGCVLVASEQQHDHWLDKSCILITESNQEETRGVILDKVSAMTFGQVSLMAGPFRASNIFLGGPTGEDLAVMIHGTDLGGHCKPLDYGVFLGGIETARQRVLDFLAQPTDFKFIFNCVSWPIGQVEQEIATGLWTVCALPTGLLVRQDDGQIGNLWKDVMKALSK